MGNCVAVTTVKTTRQSDAQARRMRRRGRASCTLSLLVILFSLLPASARHRRHSDQFPVHAQCQSLPLGKCSMLRFSVSQLELEVSPTLLYESRQNVSPFFLLFFTDFIHRKILIHSETSIQLTITLQYDMKKNYRIYC